MSWKKGGKMKAVWERLRKKCLRSSYISYMREKEKGEKRVERDVMVQ